MSTSWPITLTRPELARLVRFRLFVVPFAAQPLAGYLARHDSWYNRHIQIPFRAPFFILPRARVSPEPNFAFDSSFALARSAAQVLVMAWPKAAYNASQHRSPTHKPRDYHDLDIKRPLLRTHFDLERHPTLD